MRQNTKFVVSVILVAAILSITRAKRTTAGGLQDVSLTNPSFPDLEFPDPSTDKPTDDDPRDFPGAEGPLFKNLAKGVPQLTGADVAADGGKADAEKPSKSRTLPSSTRKLHFALRFAKKPGDSLIEIEVHNQNGKVELVENPLNSYVEDFTTGALYVDTSREAKTGEFEEGPYQAEIKLNGKPVALINWSIGAANPPGKGENPKGKAEGNAPKPENEVLTFAKETPSILEVTPPVDGSLTKVLLVAWTENPQSAKQLAGMVGKMRLEKGLADSMEFVAGVAKDKSSVSAHWSEFTVVGMTIQKGKPFGIAVARLQDSATKKPIGTAMYLSPTDSLREDKRVVIDFRRIILGADQFGPRSLDGEWRRATFVVVANISEEGALEKSWERSKPPDLPAKPGKPNGPKTKKAKPDPKADESPKVQTKELDAAKSSLNLAKNFLKNGKLESAKPHLQRVIDQAPDSEYATEAKDLLEKNYAKP